MHPLRRNAPDQKRCNAYGSGAPPPTTSPTAGNSPPQTPTVHLGRCDTASTCSPSSERDALHPLRRGTPVTSRHTRYVALHPLRRNAPVTSRYTRYVAMHPIRRGAMPTDRVHRLPQQAQPRAIRPHRPQPSTSDAATQLRHARPAPNERRYPRYVAIHPLRRDTPDQKGCNAYGSGVASLSNKPS